MRSLPIPTDACPLELRAYAFELLAEAARREAASGSATFRGDDDVFTTRSGRGPSGVSHRRWRAMAPRIPGAYRVGRWYVVPRRAYFEFVRAPKDKT